MQLEQDFAAWMKKRLRYRRVYVRERVEGRIAVRPYEVDVHGVKRDLRMLAVQAAGYGLLALSALLLFGVLPAVRERVQAAAEWWLPVPVGLALLVVGLVGVLAARLARRRRTVHAWVECKAQQATVRREQVQKLIASVDDVRRNERARWRPQQVLFVSSSGFDVDALNFARAYGIVCYRRRGKGFERVR